VKKYIFVLLFGFSQAALINLTPSYNESLKSEQTMIQFGLNESLHLLGIGTVKINASDFFDFFKKFETSQRDMYIHFGSTMIIFGGIGVSGRQYLFNSKQNILSPFLSYSSSLCYIMPFCAEDSDCDIAVFDFQSIALGLNTKLIKYKKFNLDGVLGVAYLFSISHQDQSMGAWPTLSLSLSY